MARQCMRPGCDRPVAACLTYDTEAVAVWLDDPVTDGQPAQQVCANHAATLTAPIGWTITDRRPAPADVVGRSEPEPGPGPLPVDGTAAPHRREPVPGPESAPKVPEPAPSEGAEPVREPVETSDEEAQEPAPEPDEEPAEEPAESPAAAAGPPKSLGPRGRPRGKLLDRAFGWTGPQHSILTTDSPARPDSGEVQED